MKNTFFSISLLLLAACGGEGPDVLEPDPFCEGQPLLTYNNFGKGFMTGNCQGCHASTLENRNGAPSRYIFDTLEDVQFFVEDIYFSSVGDDASMPPLGGILVDERLRLEVWLRCSPEFEGVRF